MKLEKTEGLVTKIKMKMKKVLKTMNIIIVIILISIIGVMTYGKLKGMNMFTVLTGSMEPELPVGSVIVTMPAALSDLRIGDDISYVLNEELTIVTHRIIRIDLEEEQIITQGIANKIPDQPVSYKNMIGRVVFHIPFLGHLLVHFSTAQAKIIGVTVLAAAWLILSIFSRVKK